MIPNILIIRKPPGDRTRSPRRTAWLVLVALLAALPLGPGCASWRGSSSLPVEEPQPDPGALYRGLRQWAAGIESARGVGHLKIRAAGRNLAVDALIACESPARLRVEALDFWDQAVLLATIREEEFCIYFVGENRFLREPALPAVLKDYIGVPLDGRELLALVLGRPFFVPLDSPELAVRREEGTLILMAHEPERGIRYEVCLDAGMRPARVLLNREPGLQTEPLALQVEYDRYRRLGELDFPFRIRVSNLESGETFVLHYQRLQLNQVLEETLFRFVPPATAERIRWQ